VQQVQYSGGGVTADLLRNALRAGRVPSLAGAVAAVVASNRMAAALPTLKKRMATTR
jgi:hypothetical protein